MIVDLTNLFQVQSNLQRWFGSANTGAGTLVATPVDVTLLRFFHRLEENQVVTPPELQAWQAVS